jgi:hypothetical protein
VRSRQVAAAVLAALALLAAAGCGSARRSTKAPPARLSAPQLRQAFARAGFVLDRVPPLVGQPPAWWIEPGAGRAASAALVLFPSRESVEHSVLPAGDLAFANVTVSFFHATLEQRRRILAALLDAR